LLLFELMNIAGPLLRKDRLSYPGWLVCPRHLRQQLQYGGSEQWLWRKDVFDAIAPARRAEILYELVWRRTIGFLPLEEPLEKAVKGFLSVDLPDVDTALSAELALGLMRDARVSNNADAVTLWSQYIEKKTEAGSQLRLAARYQLCLFARDLLDFALLSKLTEDLASDEPEWRLRRAALLSETGQFVKAIKLMRDAADDLEKRARLDRTSLWIKSRLGWADWLSRAVDAAHFNRRENPARERDFRDSQIDPFEEIEQIGTASAREEEGMRNDAVDVMPLFEAGHYKDGGRRRARGDGVLNRYEADQLIEAVGLPIRIGSMSLCGSMAISTAETSYRPTADWYGWLLRSLHSHYDDAFNIYFGRLAIARLSKEVAETLVSVCNTAVDFWLERFRSARVPDERDDFGHALDQLRLYIMALAHLTPRMSIVEAISAYRKGVALARVEDLRHHWLIEAIGNLLSYAAQSVPKSRRGELALDAMEFPLASEKGVQPQLWPKVATSLWGSIPRRLDNPRWRSRIDQLIEATRSSQSREDAILRLTYLAERGGLQEDERLAFGDALWSKLDAGANPLPVESGLLESTFLELPAPAGVDVQARVQARVVNANLEEILALPKPLSAAVLSDKPNQLLALQNTKALGLSIGSQRATQLFDQLTSWSPTAGQRDDPFSSSMIRGFNDRLRQTIGDILAHVVVPEMAASDRTDARGHTLIDFVTRNHAWRALPGLPHFVASVASLENNVVAILRRAIWGGDHQQVGSAASAVAIWSKLADGGLFSRQVPRALIDAILAAIEARPAQGLQTLLYAADKLIATRFLLEADMYRLMTALIPLRDDLCYDSIPERSMRAVSVSLVRAQCVELARALQKRIPDEGILAVWIADGADDPLPEVRFASMTEEQT